MTTKRQLLDRIEDLERRMSEVETRPAPIIHLQPMPNPPWSPWTITSAADSGIITDAAKPS